MAFLVRNKLRDMIRSIRACKTAAEERAVVAKECAALRDLLKEPIQNHRHRNVAKLMFIHMLGYPTHFGQMECIKLIAEGHYPEKRIGYLGLMVLLDERQEVLMLITNSIKNDLHHTNQHVVGLALCALGNICTAEMARDLTNEVERLLNDNNAYIRKKAALCAVRIVRKVPDLIESYKGPASNLLLDKHHGVLVSGVKLCIELCRASDAALEHFRKQVSTIVRILKNLVLGGYVPEYDVTGILDPLLQMKLLKLLRLVGKGDSDSSDIMSDVLAQVATNTEGTKNAGKAILYECVLTIMAIEDIGGLRVLAINILGRFLANMDNNVRYVALNTLAKVVAVDNQAVQRHRTIIVHCVKDSDVSIRARALELVVSLVNENNVKALTTELLEYLKVSDPEFKVDLAAKIAALVYKFAPTKLWYIDQIILIMVEAGKYVKEEVVWSLVAAVSNAIDLQGYAVRALYRAFHDWSGQESLAQVTVWCIGEYGDMLVNNSNELEGEDPQTVTESDAVDVVESVLHDLRVSSTTIAFSLTALLKLTSRFPQCSERIQALLEEYSRSIILELQQRSTEFKSIISRHSNLRGPLLERMPVLDLASYYTKHAGKYESRSISPVDRKLTSDSASTELTTSHLMDMLTLQPEDHSSALTVSAGDALLNILGGSPRPTSTLSSTPVRYSVGGASVLLDILAVGEQTKSTSVPQNSALSTVCRRPSTLEELLSNPLPDHRLSILELDPQCLHGTPTEMDISLRSNRTSLVEATQPPHRSSSLPFELIDEMPLTSSRVSVVGREPTTSQQRVDTEPTLAQQPRISMNDTRQQKISLNDARLQSSRGSLTQPSTPQQRRKSLFDDVLKSSEVSVTDTWPTIAQQRKIKDESESRFSRLSFHNEPTPAQQRRSLSPEEFSPASSRVFLRDTQLKSGEAPSDDTWPSPSQQQKIKEDSAVRISRISLHSESTPAQQRRSFLPGDSPAVSSRVSHRDNQLKSSEAPGDDTWPSPSQQQKLKEDSAVRISRLSFHNESTPVQQCRSFLPDDSPAVSSRVSHRDNQLKSSEAPGDDTWPSPSQQQKLKEDSAVRISRLSFHNESTPVQQCRSFLPDDSPAVSSRVSHRDNQLKSSEAPGGDTWPSPAQQQKLKEDSAVRISRLSFHNESTPAQQRRSFLPGHSPAVSSRVSHRDNQLKSSEAPADDTWPSPAQQQKLKEDSAVRISRLSFHNESTPVQQCRSFLPDDSPAVSSRVSHRDNQLKSSEAPGGDTWPSPAQQQKIKEDSAVRISRMSFHNEILPAQQRRSFLPCEDYPPIVALQTQGLRVDFEFTKSPEFPQTSVIKATFSNTSTTPYTDFIFQAAVPKYMTLKLNPSSSSSLPQNSIGVSTQVLMVTNSMHGQKPLIMRLRISYKVDGQPVLEQGQVNNFPPNL